MFISWRPLTQPKTHQKYYHTQFEWQWLITLNNVLVYILHSASMLCQIHIRQSVLKPTSFKEFKLCVKSIWISGTHDWLGKLVKTQQRQNQNKLHIIDIFYKKLKSLILSFLNPYLDAHFTTNNSQNNPHLLPKTALALKLVLHPRRKLCPYNICTHVVNKYIQITQP